MRFQRAGNKVRIIFYRSDLWVHLIGQSQTHIIMYCFYRNKKMYCSSIAHFQALHFPVLGKLIYCNESHSFSCIITRSLNWPGSYNSLKLFVTIGQGPRGL